MTEEDTVRRRPLLAIPGWLLFGCLFLPTLRVCGDPTMPLEFPPSYAVYLRDCGSGVVLSDHLKNLDWQARKTTCTGEFVSATELQKVWLLVESVVGLV